MLTEIAYVTHPFEVLMKRRVHRTPDGSPVIRRVVITMYGVEKWDVRTVVQQAHKDANGVLQCYQPGHVEAIVESGRQQLEKEFGIPFKCSKLGGLGLTGNVYYHIFPNKELGPRLVHK